MLEQKITFDRFIRWTIVTIIVVAVILLIDYLSAVLLPFAIAWLLAYLLYPIVKFNENKLKIKIRALSILLTLFVVLAIIGGAVYLIIPPMIEQFAKFADLSTKYIHEVAHIHSIPDAVSAWVDKNSTEIVNFIKSDDFTSALKSAMPKLFSFLGQTWSVIMGIVGGCIVLMYMFFILLDYEYLSENWIKIFPKSIRPFWHDLMQDAGNALNSYLRGQCLVALIMGILSCIGFTIISFPMAIGLGILIGLLYLVPYMHTFALIPMAFLAGLKSLDTGQSFWMVFGLAILVSAIIQIIIDFAVSPRIMGKQMGLNPAILLLSLSIWGALLGFVGLIIALPLTTLIMAYWQRYITKEEK